VGQEHHQGGSFRFFNQDDNVESPSMVRDGTKKPFRFNSVCLVNTYPTQIKNVVVATNKGTV
jgi:hypothetical protein